MKKIIKKAMCLLMTLCCAVACMSFVACENLQTVEIKVLANGTEYTMNVDLYKHLAPKTCKIIEQYIKDGYYDNMLIYKNSSYSSQLMFGDLKLDGDNVVLTDVKDTIYGEFEKNGTTGSNLVSEKGTLGMWRSYSAADSGSNTYKASNGMNSARSTIYMPTDSISDYTGYFCVFACYDVDDTANSETVEALTSVFSNNDNYKEYAVYYTGEYGNLEFHCILEDDFDDVEDTAFVAEGDQLVCYNKQTVKISTTTKIVSIKIK